MVGKGGGAVGKGGGVVGKGGVVEGTKRVVVMACYFSNNAAAHQQRSSQRRGLLIVRRRAELRQPTLTLRHVAPARPPWLWDSQQQLGADARVYRKHTPIAQTERA